MYPAGEHHGWPEAKKALEIGDSRAMREGTTRLRNGDGRRGLIVVFVALGNAVDVVDPGLHGVGPGGRRPVVDGVGAVVGGERHRRARGEARAVGVAPVDRRCATVDGELAPNDGSGRCRDRTLILITALKTTCAPLASVVGVQEMLVTIKSMPATPPVGVALFSADVAVPAELMALTMYQYVVPLVRPVSLKVVPV